MDCAGVQRNLQALIEGSLDGEALRAVNSHIEACGDCRVLVELAGKPADEQFDGAAELTRGVLARTSGSPCMRAESLLGGFVDGSLGELDRQLVDMHLENCTGCSTLAGVMQRMVEELPQLAEVQPDARFVSEVLAATRPRATRWATRRERWGELAGRLLQRPRIAWEGAYVAGVLVFLLLSVQGSPLASVPEKALDVARINPVEQVQRQATVWSPHLEYAWSITGGRVVDVSRSAAFNTYNRFASDVGTLWDRLASDEASVKQATNELKKNEASNGDDDERN